jgi:hypothetical protein
MYAQAKEWKQAVDRLWAAPALDYRETTQLLAEMARQGEEPRLRAAATQALPSFRTVLQRGQDQRGDRRSRDLARRHLGQVRDVLHSLTGPRFGKRREARTPEEHNRLLLGLPLDRRLYGPEIRQAYKQAAKKLHPDGGGSNGDFHELLRARDELMKAL